MGNTTLETHATTKLFTIFISRARRWRCTIAIRNLSPCKRLRAATNLGKTKLGYGNSSSYDIWHSDELEKETIPLSVSCSVILPYCSGIIGVAVMSDSCPANAMIIVAFSKGTLPKLVIDSGVTEPQEQEMRKG